LPLHLILFILGVFLTGETILRGWIHFGISNTRGGGEYWWL